ncbi:hypothetical protein EMCRGX_G000998 [Ephydatia muelleri]
MSVIVWRLTDWFIATEAQSLTCSKVPSTSSCGRGLEKQRPNYYLPQTLPDGYVITDGYITLVQTYSWINLECTQLFKSYLCLALYAPCDNKTGQPLEMCTASCQLLRSVVDGLRCQNETALILATTSSPDVLISINRFNCSDPTTYFFGNASLGFSNATCYNVTDNLNDYVMSASAAPTTRGPDVKLVQIVAPTVILVFILLSLLIVAYVIMKVLKRRRDVSTRSAAEQCDVIQGTCSTQRSIRLNEIQRYKGLFKNSFITYAQLQCDKESIGEGAFGKVYKGMLTKPGCSVEQVAIKTIKNITSDNDMKNFFKESALMIQFHHQNILGLLGVCFDSPDGTPLMVLPFMVNGSLKSYLVKSRNPLSVKPDIFPNDNLQRRLFADKHTQGLGLAIMTRMCTDIARGMSYLADQRFVHRDLAARNCLLDQDLSIKIGDFGLARDVYMTDYYKASTHVALPVKWMPPEMLHDGISNEKTDVWAYGVTCWEVFSLGATPYPGVDNHLVLEHLMKGFRLVKPVLCTEEIYQILQRCWFDSPEDRPCFSQLLTEMNALLDIPYYV